MRLRFTEMQAAFLGYLVGIGLGLLFGIAVTVWTRQ